MNNTISIQVKIEDTSLRNTLYNALRVEIAATETDRGSASVEVEGDIMSIKISAKDYVAARALSNSLLRLLKTSVDVSMVIEENQNN